MRSRDKQSGSKSTTKTRSNTDFYRHAHEARLPDDESSCFFGTREKPSAEKAGITEQGYLEYLQESLTTCVQDGYFRATGNPPVPSAVFIPRELPIHQNLQQKFERKDSSRRSISDLGPVASASLQSIEKKNKKERRIGKLTSSLSRLSCGTGISEKIFHDNYSTHVAGRFDRSRDESNGTLRYSERHGTGSSNKPYSLDLYSENSHCNTKSVSTKGYQGIHSTLFDHVEAYLAETYDEPMDVIDPCPCNNMAFDCGVITAQDDSYGSSSHTDTNCTESFQRGKELVRSRSLPSAITQRLRRMNSKESFYLI